jgi:hypothetical protein
MTKLEKALKREISIDNEPWVLTIAPDGLTLTPKGKRKGHHLAWKAIVTGETALTAALNASVSGGSAEAESETA